MLYTVFADLHFSDQWHAEDNESGEEETELVDTSVCVVLRVNTVTDASYYYISVRFGQGHGATEELEGNTRCLFSFFRPPPPPPFF